MSNEQAVMAAGAGVVESTHPRRSGSRVAYAVYGLCLAAAVGTWFTAINAPLWVDENLKYWSIAKGFWQIPARRDWLTFPAYSYILWLATKVLGTSEIALRIPSLLAMAGAAWLLYLAAREMFERDVAAIAVVVFCLHPAVVFEAADVGVYSIATLITCAGILAALRLRRSESQGTAVLLGLAAAGVLWFHFLFAVVIPALVACFFVVKRGSGGKLWRQFGAATGGFALGLLPVMAGVLGMFRTRGTHDFMPTPQWFDLLVAVIPGLKAFGALVFGLFAALLVAAAEKPGEKRERGRRGDGLVCAAMAAIPLAILYGVSVLTPLHVSDPPWHMLPAVPGIALCWAWLAREVKLGLLRVIFCLLIVGAGVYLAVTAPMSKAVPRWKAAEETVERLAGVEATPVLICSNFVEADHTPAPLGTAKESRLFAQLEYYKLNLPVVPLPMTLNDEARRIGGDFVEQAAARHERFLAMGGDISNDTMDWLAQQAAGAYTVRVVGIYDYVRVMEFTPRSR